MNQDVFAGHDEKAAVKSNLMNCCRSIMTINETNVVVFKTLQIQLKEINMSVSQRKLSICGFNRTTIRLYYCT
jgi:hypothetical protein